MRAGRRLGEAGGATAGGQWRAEILTYFTTGGVSNGGTEAINGVIEKTRRLAHGFRNFTSYRIRILLAADGSRPYRRQPRAAASSAEPCVGPGPAGYMLRDSR